MKVGLNLFTRHTNPGRKQRVKGSLHNKPEERATALEKYLQETDSARQQASVVDEKQPKVGTTPVEERVVPLPQESEENIDSEGVVPPWIGNISAVDGR